MAMCGLCRDPRRGGDINYSSCVNNLTKDYKCVVAVFLCTVCFIACDCIVPPSIVYITLIGMGRCLPLDAGRECNYAPHPP